MNPVVSDLPGTIIYLQDQRNMERDTGNLGEDAEKPKVLLLTSAKAEFRC